MFNYVSVNAYRGSCECKCPPSQRCHMSLELELQVPWSRLMWVLGPNSGSLRKQKVLLTAEHPSTAGFAVFRKFILRILWAYRSSFVCEPEFPRHLWKWFLNSSNAPPSSLLSFVKKNENVYHSGARNTLVVLLLLDACDSKVRPAQCFWRSASHIRQIRQSLWITRNPTNGPQSLRSPHSLESTSFLPNEWGCKLVRSRHSSSTSFQSQMASRVDQLVYMASVWPQKLPSLNVAF